MIITSQLAKIRPSSVKMRRTQVPSGKSAHFSSSWGLTRKVLNYFYMFRLSLRRAFRRYIDTDNRKVNLDMVSKNIFAQTKYLIYILLETTPCYYEYHGRGGQKRLPSLFPSE